VQRSVDGVADHDAAQFVRLHSRGGVAPVASSRNAAPT
jgi:hypothetical protein